MPSLRPTLSTWISWPSPTESNSEVSGANGSPRCPRPTSGDIAAFCLERATCKIAVEEAVAVPGRLFGGELENPLMMRRQRAGGIGIAGIARQRKGLASAAAEIDLPEFAALAGLAHPARPAISVEGFRVLPDPGDRMIGSHRFEFEPGNALRRVARQNFSRRRDVE